MPTLIKLQTVVNGLVEEAYCKGVLALLMVKGAFTGLSDVLWIILTSVHGREE